MTSPSVTARVILLVFTWFVTGTAAWSDDRRHDRTHLTVMTFNAEFLWDGVAPEDGNPSVNFPWKGDRALAEEHMQKVAQTIIASDPDVVNLCEVEGLDALNVLNDRFLQGRGYKAYLVDGRDSQTGQDVGLLTRIDPVVPLKYDDRKGQSGRTRKSVSKNYTARLEVGDLKVALIGIHLLAFPDDPDRRFQREAQARAIQSMAIDQADDGFQVIVLGDVNDFDGSAEARDHVNHQPVSNVLRILRAMNEATAADNLFNVAAEAPRAQRYTAFFDRNNDGQAQPSTELSSIDHILVSRGLRQAIDFVEFPHVTPPGSVSDHFPIVVRFRTPSSSGFQETIPANPVRLISLLPCPAGDETKREAATLKNLGSAPINLAGWRLRDLSGKSWKLDSLGTLAAGQAKTIRRDGQEMALSNLGGTIDLLDANKTIVQTVTYPSMIDDRDEEFELDTDTGNDAPAAGFRDTSSTAAPKILVGALNIEWLGNPEKRSGSARNHAQDPNEIAAYIKSSNVAILALEEISDDDGVDATRTNKTLAKAFEELNANGQAKWKHRLFAKHPGAENSSQQLTGLAWNEAVVAPDANAPGGAEGYRLKLKLPEGVTEDPQKPIFERWATAMKFSAGNGKSDFVVIPIHLKSNRAAFPGQDVVGQRAIEARMLLAALGDVQQQFADEDVIIIGDSNVLKNDETAIATLTASGFVDLNSQDLPTYISGQYRSPFDRAFVPNPAGNDQAAEFANSTFQVLAHPTFSAAEYRKRISDHRMIRLGVEVLADDD